MRLLISYFANVTNQRYWLHEKLARLICEQGFKNEKEARIIVRCELLYTNFWSVISTYFL